MTTYTVQKGDSLSSIAAAELGDSRLWPTLATLNKLADPNLIYPGQVLQLPGNQAVPATVAPGSAPAPAGPGTWTAALSWIMQNKALIAVALIGVGVMAYAANKSARKKQPRKKRRKRR